MPWEAEAEDDDQFWGMAEANVRMFPRGADGHGVPRSDWLAGTNAFLIPYKTGPPPV